MTNVIKLLGLLVPLTLAGIRGADALEHKVQSMNSKPKSTATSSVKNSTPTFSIKNSTAPYNVGNSTAPAKQYAKNSAKPAKQASSAPRTSLLDKLEFEVGAGAELYSGNPIDDYYKQVNQDFRDGKYTFTTPIPDWKDIKADNFNSTGAEASIKYEINDKTKVGIVLGSNSGKSTNNYSQDYDIYDAVNDVTVPLNFERTETFDVSAPSIGIKFERDLSKKFSVSLTEKSESVKIDGNLDYTMNGNPNSLVRGPPWESTQWRTASFNGNGTVNSIDVGTDWNITKNISVGLNIGAKTGKVQTKGEQVRTQNTNDEVIISDYSPEFDFNSSYGKFELKLKF